MAFKNETQPKVKPEEPTTTSSLQKCSCGRYPEAFADISYHTCTHCHAFKCYHCMYSTTRCCPCAASARLIHVFTPHVDGAGRNMGDAYYNVFPVTLPPLKPEPIVKPKFKIPEPDAFARGWMGRLPGYL